VTSAFFVDSTEWRCGTGGGYGYPVAYMAVGLAAPLAVQAAAYYGVYVGVFPPY